MKKKLTSALAIFLTMIIAFSAVVIPATATDEPCDCEYCPSIVIPGLFQSDVMYLDENGNEMLNAQGQPYAAPFFLEGTTDIIKLALEKAILPIGEMLITQKDKEKRSAQAIADVLGEVLVGNIIMDEKGMPVKNIVPDVYNGSMAKMREDQIEHVLNAVPLDAYVEIAGLDHLYFHSYLHSGNIKKAAEDLYDLIQTAKKETGHDKVNLVPISQGGSVENALMQLYIDRGLDFSEDVNRVCYVVPAADGAYLLGDIYRYGFIDDDEALYGYLMPSLLGEDNYLSYLVTLLLRIFPKEVLGNILDTAVDTLIEDYLERSTCLWGLIPSKDYPELRQRYLLDEEDKYILEQTDWYYNAQLNSRQYILDAKAKGVKFFDIADYNSESFKIFDSWNSMNGDGVIHTDSEAFGATTVSVDKSLPEDYKQANTYCTDPENHCHIDEKRLIDASTGILCETTFYFRDQSHESTASNDVIMRLAVRILTDESFVDVYSDPAYPQFNYARSSKGIINIYDTWKDLDLSEVSPSLAAEYTRAKAEVEKAIASTVMPTEQFNAVAEDFENVIYKIATGREKPEENGPLAKLLTKVLRFFCQLMMKLFGGNGYSDIIASGLPFKK